MALPVIVDSTGQIMPYSETHRGNGLQYIESPCFGNVPVGPGAVSIPIVSTLTTTDATLTAIFVVPLVQSTCNSFQANILAHQTGGAGGTLDQSGFFTLLACFKRPVAGSASQVGTTISSFMANDGTWLVQFALNGNNMLVQVQGGANEIIAWQCTLYHSSVST